MKKINSIIISSLIGIFAFTSIAEAYWIWTPQTKKFINPKYAVKDSPKEQYEWAMSFYDAKDYQRAATEFEKLAKQYEFSEYASKSQYYVGLCYENMQKYYIAFENYQKAIDNFPHIENTDEILARQFAIGNIYLNKTNPKVLGTDIMAPLDRAVEIFKKVVENAPYGKYSEEAQFKLGEALKKSERYEEAVQAYHRLVDDYPNSKFASQAMYEESYCAYKASLKPAYDVAATDKAIKTFEKFAVKNKDTELAKNADKTMKRLKDNIAEKSFKTAQFYESQGKKEAAIIYYQDVIDTYPDSTFAEQAKSKIDVLSAKKKPIIIVQEEPKKKEPWKPLNFFTRKETKQEKAAQEEPSKKKASWNPLGFMTKKEVKQEEPKQKEPWKPLDFSSKKEVKQEETIKEEPKKKEPWKPLAFFTRKETKQGETVKEGPGKKDPWKPLSFSSNKEARQEETAKEEPKKKVSWNPLGFITKKKDKQEEPKKKEPWKPFNFETNKTKESGEWKPLSSDTTIKEEQR